MKTTCRKYRHHYQRRGDDCPFCEMELLRGVHEAASMSVNIDRRSDLVKWFQRLATAIGEVDRKS